MAFNNNFNKNSNQGNNKGQKPEPIFPNGYLDGGYFEDKEKKILKSEYIVEYSKHIAESLSSDKNKNKSTQLRKYYEFAIRIKDTLKYNIKTFEEVKSEINKLAPSSSYAKTKGNVTDCFVDFIKKNLENIKTEEDFFAFATHFEAIIAYLPKRK